MSAHISHQVAQAFPFVISCHLVVRVAEDTFDGVRPGTIGRQPEQLEAGMSGQPTLDRLRFVDSIVVDYHRDSVIAAGRITEVRGGEQNPAELGGFGRAAKIIKSSRAEIPPARPIMFFAFSRGAPL